MKKIILLATFSMLALTPESFARKKGEEPAQFKDHNAVKEDGKTVLYKKRNVVDFDGATIEGEIKNPGEFYFVHRPEEKFGTLIKRRKNFHKEMLRDTVMMR